MEDRGARETAEKQFFEKEFLFFSRFGNRSYDFWMEATVSVESGMD